MKKIITSVIALVALFGVQSAKAWGTWGHHAVAFIAEKHLTPEAKEKCQHYLKHNLPHYSSWQDYWRHSDPFKEISFWHSSYVNKKFDVIGYKEDETRDAAYQVARITKEMSKGKYKNMSASLVAVNLKLLIHMVGDMHCPMHAGRLSDRGGNGTRVMWFRNETSLHSVWDSKMIDSARQWSYSEWCEQLDRKSRKYRKEIVKGDYEDWFMKTVEEAAKLYDYVESTGEIVPSLSYQFVYDFTPLLEEQLLNAGYRLAYVLNEIFD